MPPALPQTATDRATAASRLPALDAMRAIGSFAVVGTHAAITTGAAFRGISGGFLSRLDIGVALFFALSGFLLFRPMVLAVATGTPHPSNGRYLWRRAVRILPAYWIAVVAAFTLLAENAGAPARDWVRYLTLTHVYSPNWVRNGISQSWSLAAEMVFYLVLPLAAPLALGRRWRPARTLALTAGGGTIISAAWIAGMTAGVLRWDVHTSWMPTYAAWFGVGMALATAHVALRTGTAPRRWVVLDQLGAAPVTCWVVALSVMAVASTSIAGPRTISRFTTLQLSMKALLDITVAAMVLIPAAFGPEATRYKKVLSSRLFGWFGTVSYGVFLWHQLVLALVYRVEHRPLFSGHFVEVFVTTVVFSVVLAALSWYALEQPLLRWSARWPGRWTEQRRQPQTSDAAQPEGLRPARGVAVVPTQRGPGGEDQQSARKPGFQTA